MVIHRNIFRVAQHTPISVLLPLSLALFFVISLLFLPRAHAEGPTNGHLITIHDRGEERSLISEKDTLREVFADANISIDPSDIVEPGLDEKLVARSYQVNVYRARPVTIVDGVRRTKVMTAYQTPEQIAKYAGIELHSEDTTQFNLNSDLASDGAGVELVIDRALQINLVLYGKEETVYTQASTVDQFLKDKQVAVQPEDTLSVDRKTAVVAGMRIEIWRNGKQTVTVEEPVDFATEKIQDANQPVGYHEVRTPGVKGKKSVTYEITMKNGVEQSRTKIQDVVITQPEKQIEIIGAKASLPSGSHEDWMAAAGISGGDYGYVNYIFSHESGWNPAAVSPNGYYGLGQTSLSNISSACPNWQTDPVCQIRFFNGYAVSRYGSWNGAYNFWVGHHWW